MKICTKCKINKKCDAFSKHHKNKDGLSYWCRSCMKKYDKERHLKNPWKRIFYDIQNRCNSPKNKKYYLYGGKGIKNNLTMNELKELWFRDKAYEMKKPSIDRIDNDGNYEYDNCRFIEHRLNSSRANLGKGHKILQYSLDEKFIKEWNSAKEVALVFNRHPLTINSSCRYNWTTAGFKWKYKERT